MQCIISSVFGYLIIEYLINGDVFLQVVQKSYKLSFDGYIDLFVVKIEEGNKIKGNKDQRRGVDGKFGNKNLLDCFWRIWLKSMFIEYLGVLCKCFCNY